MIEKIKCQHERSNCIGQPNQYDKKPSYPFHIITKVPFNVGQGLGVVKGLVHQLLAVLVGEVVTALFSVFVGDS